MGSSVHVLSAFVLSLALAVGFTPLFGRLARRIGLVVEPRADRWHRRATPLLGGAAMALAAGIGLAVFIDRPTVAPGWAVLAGGMAAFALGLADDMHRLAPTSKLVGQAMIGTLLYLGGVGFEIIAFPPLAFILTVFWFVALMNAINLMDNMDGLASGVVAIGAAVLAATAIGTNPGASLLAAVTAGAALGFLAHNFHPARIFMGDAGSMLLGYLLAAATLMHTATGAANVAVALLGPLVVLGLPIFDTALVIASRVWSGMPVSRGGRDHTSHRLAALGLSDRGTVLFLYGIAGMLGVFGLALDEISALVLPLVSLAVVSLALLGVFLFEGSELGDAVAGPASDVRAHVRRRVATSIRFGVEVGLDVILLTTAYYLAYLVRFEGLPDSAWLHLFVQSLPIVVSLQLAALVVLGVYRTLWRYLSVTDAVAILRAVSLGTLVAVIGLVIAFRFEGYSRAVLIMDWLAASAFLIGSRSFLLWLRHWFEARPRMGGRRVLVVGANDAGAAATRLLARGGEASHHTVGYLDDDPGKLYRRIGGVRVVGRTDEIDRYIRALDVQVVVIAIDDDAVRERVRAACDTLGVQCREFLLTV